MRKLIEQKILQIHKATGAELIIRSNDDWVMYACTAITKKGSIFPESFATIGAEEENISKKINRDIPVSLVLNGKGVLTKLVTGSSNADNLFASILPGANPSEFYYERYTVADRSAISVIRKETVDKIIHQLKEKGFRILSVSFGFGPIATILSFIEPAGGPVIETSTFSIQLNDQAKLLDFKIKDDTDAPIDQAEYRIADQYIKPYRLLSFAAAINLLTDSITAPVSVPCAGVTEQRADYRYYKYFRFAGLALLGAIFFVLLVSFLVYSHYYELNNEMQATQSISDLQNQKVRKTETDITQKEKFLSRSGWVSQSKTSYYADRIAALTPGDVLLRSMNVYPLKAASMSEEGSILCKKDTIELTGICYDPVVLNQFISGLKIIPDFSKVTVKSYQYRKEEEAGAFSMEVITK